MRVAAVRIASTRVAVPVAERDAMRSDPTKFKRPGKFLPLEIDYGADEDFSEPPAEIMPRSDVEFIEIAGRIRRDLNH